MTVQEIALIAGVVTGLLGGAIAVARYLHDRRTGISSDERLARRDKSADWAAFAAETRQLLAAERVDSAQLRAALAAKDARIDHLDARLEEKSRTIRALADHVDVLEHHIWQRLGPPPPARPEGI